MPNLRQSDDEEKGVRLQIPYKAKNQDMQMFQHPYGKMAIPVVVDQHSDESTRIYTKRNGGGESSMGTSNSRQVHLNVSEISVNTANSHSNKA